MNGNTHVVTNGGHGHGGNTNTCGERTCTAILAMATDKKPCVDNNRCNAACVAVVATATRAWIGTMVNNNRIGNGCNVCGGNTHVRTVCTAIAATATNKD